MVWDELDRGVKEKQPTSGTMCGNSFKTVGQVFQVKLVERMPTKYFDLLSTFFGYSMLPYVLFHSFDVFTIVLQCRK
jgi:hypothetical protein